MDDLAIEAASKECEEKGWMVRTIDGKWKLTPEGKKHVEEMIEEGEQRGEV